MTVPLMRYLQLASQRKIVKTGMLVSMGLTIVAILGTQSRGALIGLLAMAAYLTMKSRNKMGIILALALTLPAALMVMPESWYSRMDTIKTYEQDQSAMGRINAWWTAWYLALDHPFVGGGFETFQRPTFRQYAPEPENMHYAHSIYFQALGEHGFVGLFTFLGIMLVSLSTLSRVIKFAKLDAELAWMRDLGSMVYVSIIGYATSGAFLGLANFDYYYTLVAITVGLGSMMLRYSQEGMADLTGSKRPPRPVEPVTARRFGNGADQPDAGKRPFSWPDVGGWFAKL
jgi:probable O-glycosylation ligase (exosortase A-associated)